MIARKRYAEKAPGRTETYPKLLSRGLSVILRQYPSSNQDGVLTKDIGHFVFEVLGGNERVQKFLSTFDHGMDLATTTAEMGIIIKRLPKVIDGFMTRLSTGIDENTYLRLLKVVKHAKRKALIYSRLASGLWH